MRLGSKRSHTCDRLLVLWLWGRFSTRLYRAGPPPVSWPQQIDARRGLCTSLRFTTPEELFSFKPGSALTMEQELVGVVEDLQASAQRDNIKRA